jgi:hypothetical protein
MSDGKILPFTGQTIGAVPLEKVLEAVKEQCDDAFIIGFKDGQMILFDSTSGTYWSAIGMLEEVKAILMEYIRP